MQTITVIDPSRDPYPGRIPDFQLHNVKFTKLSRDHSQEDDSFTHPKPARSILVESSNYPMSLIHMSPVNNDKPPLRRMTRTAQAIFRARGRDTTQMQGYRFETPYKGSWNPSGTDYESDDQSTITCLLNEVIGEPQLIHLYGLIQDDFQMEPYGCPALWLPHPVKKADPDQYQDFELAALAFHSIEQSFDLTQKNPDADKVCIFIEHKNMVSITMSLNQSYDNMQASHLETEMESTVLDHPVLKGHNPSWALQIIHLDEPWDQPPQATRIYTL